MGKGVVWGCYHGGMCVPWLAVIGYVWFNVCSEWLQVVSGRELCGGGMCICWSVSEGVLFRIAICCVL